MRNAPLLRRRVRRLVAASSLSSLALAFAGCGNSDQSTGVIQEPVAAKKANNAMEEFMRKQGKMPGAPAKK
jgi:hypothetical protein